MADLLYLFDGYNLLHTSDCADARELVDRLTDFVALRGARGIVVFDGVGTDATLGPLEIRYAADADTLLERLAAERRGRDEVTLVSSDAAIRSTVGAVVTKLSSQDFVRELRSGEHVERRRSELLDRLDADTLAQLERLRRGHD